MEEIDDQKEQVNEKERAPYSKKRQSDQRLEIAIENFQLFKQQHMDELKLWGDLLGVSIQSTLGGKVIVRVEFDEIRFFELSIHETPKEGMLVISFVKVNVLEGDKIELIPHVIMDEEEPRFPN